MDMKNINDSTVFSDKTFTKRVLYATDDILTFVLNLKPGQQLPIHKHENTSLVLHVLSGSGTIKINEETERLESGNVLYAKGEDDFGIPEVTEDMSIMVAISPNPSNAMYAKSIG